MSRIWPAVACLFFATACIEDAPEEPEVEADQGVGGVDGDVMPDVGDELTAPDMDPGLAPDMAAQPPIETCGNEDSLAPNQSAADAATIEPGFARDDLFLCAETEDWFRLALAAGQGVTIRLQADPVETDLDLAVLDGAGVVLEESTEEFGEEQVEFVAPAAGEYLVRVAGFREQASFYAFAVESGCRMDANCPDGVCDPFRGRCAAFEAPDCGADDFEPNDRDSEGAAIEAGDEIEGVLCGSDRDWFVLEVERGASADVLVGFAGGQDIDVFVLDLATGRRVAEATGDRRTNPERLSLSHLPAGRYAMGLFLFTPEGERDREVDYRVEVVGRSGACAIDRDCANAALPVCEDGVCHAVDAGGAAMPGERCGEDGDCDGRSEFCWTGGEGGHDNYCSRRCDGEGQCDDLGDAAYCTPIGRGAAICVPPCASDDDCSGFRACREGVCEIRGECRIDDDCADGEVCASTQFGRYCGIAPPAADCGDDAREPDSSRRAAQAIAPDGVTVDGLNICDGDDDWFHIVVPAENAAWLLMVSVEFREGVDIDLYVYDAAGNLMGQAISAEETTETAEIRFIAPGDYFARVDQFSSDALRDTSYAITVDLVDNEDACTVEGNECGGTDPLRTQCLEEIGACAALEGAGEVPLGGLCDSDDDCGEDADVCWVFEGGDNGWNICTRGCQGEGDCADIEGTVCTRFQRFAACLPAR